MIYLIFSLFVNVMVVAYLFKINQDLEGALDKETALHRETLYHLQRILDRDCDTNDKDYGLLCFYCGREFEKGHENYCSFILAQDFVNKHFRVFTYSL